MDRKERNTLIDQALITYRCTTVAVKAEHWPTFWARVDKRKGKLMDAVDPDAKHMWHDIISNQFTQCGVKYAFTDTAEWTDIIRHFDPKWVLGTMLKYIGRFEHFKRERDLIKIATYAFILWLQDGWFDLPIENLSDGPPFSGNRWDAIMDSTTSDPFLKDILMSIYDYDDEMKELDLINIFVGCFMVWKEHKFNEVKEHDEDVGQTKTDVEELPGGGAKISNP